MPQQRSWRKGERNGGRGGGSEKEGVQRPPVQGEQHIKLLLLGGEGEGRGAEQRVAPQRRVSTSKESDNEGQRGTTVVGYKGGDHRLVGDRGERPCLVKQ